MTQMITTAPQYGAIIKEGPQNWQIIQQKNGSADIFLSGQWFLDEATGTEKVYAKIADENTGRPIIPITPAQTGKDGSWEVLLKDVPAGGLYRIEVCINNNNEGIEWSYRGDMRYHIGVGDLFAIAGQSNAAGYGRDPVYDEPRLGIHCLRGDGAWDLATHPLADSTDIIKPVNRERINPAHSPYLTFAKELHRHLNYPVGLIPCAKGGSALASWDPHESGELLDNLFSRVQDAGGAIKGVLWYQGCSDTGEETSKTYPQRFEGVVNAVRSEFGRELPFFTIQLNRHVDADVEQKDDGWGRVKEAQRLAAKSIPNLYVIPSIDGAVCDVIHNSAAFNLVLGQRLAAQALNHLYGIYTLCDAPDIAGAKQTGKTTIRLTFDNVNERLDFRKAAPSLLPFAAEDEGGALRVLSCVVEKNELELEVDRPITGSAFISYGAQQCPLGQCISDSISFLPILAFYRFKIESHHK